MAGYFGFSMRLPGAIPSNFFIITALMCDGSVLQQHRQGWSNAQPWFGCWLRQGISRHRRRLHDLNLAMPSSRPTRDPNGGVAGHRRLSSSAGVNVPVPPLLPDALTLQRVDDVTGDLKTLRAVHGPNPCTAKRAASEAARPREQRMKLHGQENSA